MTAASIHCVPIICQALLGQILQSAGQSVNHIEEGISQPFSGNNIIHLLLWHLLKSHTQKLTWILQLLLKTLKVVNSSKCEYSTNERSESNSDFLLTSWLHQNQNCTGKADYAADESQDLGNRAFAKTCYNTAYVLIANGSEICTCRAFGWTGDSSEGESYAHTSRVKQGLNADTQKACRLSNCSTWKSFKAAYISCWKFLTFHD